VRNSSFTVRLDVLKYLVDRLVESSRIKRALEACYTAILPKGTSPFIYLRQVHSLFSGILEEVDMVMQHTTGSNNS
jgi:hypothetical protein